MQQGKAPPPSDSQSQPYQPETAMRERVAQHMITKISCLIPGVEREKIMNYVICKEGDIASSSNNKQAYLNKIADFLRQAESSAGKKQAPPAGKFQTHPGSRSGQAQATHAPLRVPHQSNAAIPTNANSNTNRAVQGTPRPATVVENRAKAVLLAPIRIPVPQKRKRSSASVLPSSSGGGRPASQHPPRVSSRNSAKMSRTQRGRQGNVTTQANLVQAQLPSSSVAQPRASAAAATSLLQKSNDERIWLELKAVKTKYWAHVRYLYWVISSFAPYFPEDLKPNIVPLSRNLCKAARFMQTNKADTLPKWLLESTPDQISLVLEKWMRSPVATKAREIGIQVTDQRFQFITKLKGEYQERAEQVYREGMNAKMFQILSRSEDEFLRKLGVYVRVLRFSSASEVSIKFDTTELRKMQTFLQEEVMPRYKPPAENTKIRETSKECEALCQPSSAQRRTEGEKKSVHCDGLLIKRPRAKELEKTSSHHDSTRNLPIHAKKTIQKRKDIRNHMRSITVKPQTENFGNMPTDVPGKKSDMSAVITGTGNETVQVTKSIEQLRGTEFQAFPTGVLSLEELLGEAGHSQGHHAENQNSNYPSIQGPLCDQVGQGPQDIIASRVETSPGKCKAPVSIKPMSSNEILDFNRSSDSHLSPQKLLGTANGIGSSGVSQPDDVEKVVLDETANEAHVLLKHGESPQEYVGDVLVGDLVPELNDLDAPIGTQAVPDFEENDMDWGELDIFAQAFDSSRRENNPPENFASPATEGKSSTLSTVGLKDTSDNTGSSKGNGVRKDAPANLEVVAEDVNAVNRVVDRILPQEFDDPMNGNGVEEGQCLKGIGGDMPPRGA